jgi:hypothetical protein
MELTESDALAAHVDVELGINPDDLSNPWQARPVVSGCVHPGRARATDRNPFAAKGSPCLVQRMPREPSPAAGLTAKNCQLY